MVFISSESSSLSDLECPEVIQITAVAPKYSPICRIANFLNFFHIFFSVKKILKNANFGAFDSTITRNHRMILLHLFVWCIRVFGAFLPFWAPSFIIIFMKKRFMNGRKSCKINIYSLQSYSSIFEFGKRTKCVCYLKLMNVFIFMVSVFFVIFRPVARKFKKKKKMKARFLSDRSFSYMQNENSSLNGYKACRE